MLHIIPECILRIISQIPVDLSLRKNAILDGKYLCVYIQIEYFRRSDKGVPRERNGETLSTGQVEVFSAIWHARGNSRSPYFEFSIDKLTFPVLRALKLIPGRIDKFGFENDQQTSGRGE